MPRRPPLFALREKGDSRYVKREEEEKKSRREDGKREERRRREGNQRRRDRVRSRGQVWRRSKRSQNRKKELWKALGGRKKA